MVLLTPAKACIYINGFNSRIDRLIKNEYSAIKFRTYDINRLKHEIKMIHLVCSIAIFNKNEGDAFNLINEAEKRINTGREILINNK